MHTGIAHQWHCTPDTGAQVTISGLAILTRLNLRQADLIPVSQKVTTANDVYLTILGAIVVKLTSVTSLRRSPHPLCYISKECHGLYLSLTACTSLGIVHASFPQPMAKVVLLMCQTAPKSQKAAKGPVLAIAIRLPPADVLV